MKAPKVSILVPVYNTSHYLCECLDSLIGQSLRDIEIICIDDGSTDTSPRILDEYAARDKRVRVVHQKNAGYGVAMNKGLGLATGEFVGICESDDFASRNMYSTLYKYAHNHYLDLVKSNYYEHDAGKDHKARVFDPFPYRITFDPDEEKPEIIRVLPAIWAALYRREMIEGYHIRFNETPGAAYQDTFFVFQAWMCARRVALLPGAYLHYRVDSMDSSSKSTKKIYEVCIEFESDEAFLQAHPEKLEVYGGILQAVKYSAYRWNYNRIAQTSRPEFASRMAEDFRAARDRGELDQKHFNSQEWEEIQLLLEDPRAFYESHEDAL